VLPLTLLSALSSPISSSYWKKTAAPRLANILLREFLRDSRTNHRILVLASGEERAPVLHVAQKQQWWRLQHRKRFTLKARAPNPKTASSEW